MATFDNTNRGILSKNDRRENDRQPGYRGKINTKCPHCSTASDHRLSGWDQTRKSDGEPFVSLAASHDDAPRERAPLTIVAPVKEDLDDVVPF